MIANYLIKFLHEYCWIHRQIILERVSQFEKNIPKAEDVLISWRTSKLDDIMRMASEGDMNINKENLPYYYAIISDGNRMMLGEINNEIVAYVCVVFGRKVFVNRYFELAPDEGFALAGFTKANWRGKGLGVCALEELRKCLMINKPSLHLFCHVNSSNQSSLRMLEKAGWVSANTNLYRIRLLKWDFVFQTGRYRRRFIRDLQISQPRKELLDEKNKKMVSYS